MYLDKIDKSLELIAIGDGVVSYNEKLVIYDQNDRPDYLGYHFEKNFDDWFQQQTQRLSLKDIRELSICSDGIFSFKPFNDKFYPNIEIERVLNYFLFDKEFENQSNMLKRKLYEIETKYGLKPSDDFTMIRLINDDAI